MRRIERAWEEGGALAAALRPLGALARPLLGLREALYGVGLLSTVPPPLPLVVVGNLTVGGSGKTPLTGYLIEAFRARGWRPGVVSRGYGGTRHEEPRLVCADDAAREVGDEPLMLHRESAAPVCVCVRRARAVATLARETDCDLVLADDGLQHRAMGRDAEIVVVDGVRGFGNGRLLPAGPLRERVTRLHRVDLIALRVPPEALRRAGEPSGSRRAPVSADAATGSRGPAPPRARRQTRSEERVARGAGDAAVPAAAVTELPGAAGLDASRLPPTFRFATGRPRAYRWPDGDRRPLAELAGRRVNAVAGIARPERFFATLRAAGLELVATRALPDHHPLAAADLVFDESLPVLVTTKDAARLDGLAPPPAALHVVALEVEIDGDGARALDALSARLRARAPSADGGGKIA